MSGILGFGQSMLGSYQNYRQQSYDYERQMAQNEMAKRQLDNEAKTRAAQAVLQYQQIQLAEQEANAEAAQAKTDTARAMLKARALNKVAASGAGIGGNVVDRLDTDMAHTEAQKLAAIETTRESAIDQLENEKTASYLSAKTQPLITYDPGAPSFGASALLGAAINGVSGYHAAGGSFSLSDYKKRLSEVSSYSIGNSRIQ